MDILKMSLMAVVVVIISVTLKGNNSSVYIALSIAMSVIIAVYITSKMSGIIKSLSFFGEYIGESNYYCYLLIKIIGITYVVQFASDICRDNGYNAVAGQLEVLGRITIAVLCIPVIGALLEMVKKCVG